MLRPAEPLSESPWIPAFVLAFGLASVILLVASDRIRQRSTTEDAYSLLDCEQIRVDLAISHLWLEEHVSGDAVEVQEIVRRLDDAIGHLDQMAGTVVLEPAVAADLISPPLHDAALRRRAATLRPEVDNFRTLSIERIQGFARQLPVGIGSPLEGEYDRAFGELMSAMEWLEADLREHHRQHRQQAHRLFLTIVVLWSLLVGLAALGLWARQGRQKKAELDLEESRAQLTHSQRMDAAGRLAGGLAHDLSNYLAAIRGHCELTRLKAPAGPQLAHRMDEVIHTVDRASDLVDRLLAFGRRQPMHPTAVDVDRLLNDVAEMLAPSMGDRVRLDVSPRSHPWTIQVDRIGLEQSLVNLLVNARDAMPEGGRVQLGSRRLRGSEAPSEEVEISVSDDGMGIAPQDLDKIFDPFWTSKRSAGGSGLGLSVVYSFVEQSGGRLNVESTVGQGTTFRLLFPRGADGAAGLEDPTQVSSATDKGSPSEPDGPLETDDPLLEEGLEELLDGDLEGHETLLLVDDNDALRRATEEVLEALGYRVLGAADGATALTLARQQEVDLYILDLVLPDMDGRQLLEDLRAQRHGSGPGSGTGGTVPTILISGHHPQDLDLTASPAVQFLAKRQLSAFRLAQRIRQQLDGPADTG